MNAETREVIRKGVPENREMLRDVERRYRGELTRRQQAQLEARRKEWNRQEKRRKLKALLPILAWAGVAGAIGALFVRFFAW